MSGLLLDTHIWVWLSQGVSLTKKQQVLIDDYADDNELFVSAMSVWEIAMLASKGRLNLGMSCHTWVEKFLRNTPLQVIDFNPEIAMESCYLPADFHADPADRIIVATARVKNLTLMTRDKNIIKYGVEKHLRVLMG